MATARHGRERLLTYAMRVARVVAYVAVVSAILGLFALRSVYGAVEESALQIGGELVQLGDVIGPANRVRLNGEPIFVSSAMTDRPVAAVLDRFEAECRAHAGGLAEEMADLPRAVRDELPPALEGAAGIGVLRRDEGGKGMVACLARDDAGGGASIARALRAFAASGDLAAIGKLRYVVAERAPGSTRTHVVAAWTEGAFRVGAIFPRGGDAPGSDVAEAPRPDRARRLLTASIEGAPYGVRIYDAAATPDEVLARYDAEMPARGWAAVPGAAREMKGGRAFSRGGVDVIVATQRDGDRAIVSVVEMPPR